MTEKLGAFMDIKSPESVLAESRSSETGVLTGYSAAGEAKVGVTSVEDESQQRDILDNLDFWKVFNGRRRKRMGCDVSACTCFEGVGSVF